MEEKRKIKYNLTEESGQLTDILMNQEQLRFIEQRKALTDLVNEMLLKAHGDQPGPVNLLPLVEIPKADNLARRQSLTGEKPTPHHSFSVNR